MTIEFIKELLTTYWSQMTLIIAIIGYFGKRILDNISKKREINHNLFQQKRLESVNDFFTNYAKIDQMWRGIPIINMLNNEIPIKEIDEIIFTPINELSRNTLELQIYFNEIEHKYFSQILDNTYSINSELSLIYFDFDKDKTPIQKSNEFHIFREAKFRENEQLFKKISEMIKNTFK